MQLGGSGDRVTHEAMPHLLGAGFLAGEMFSGGAFKSPLPQTHSLQSMRPVADGEGTQTALKMQFEPMKANHGRTRHPTSVTIVLRLPAPALLPFPSAASSEGGISSAVASW